MIATHTIDRINPLVPFVVILLVLVFVAGEGYWLLRGHEENRSLERNNFLLAETNRQTKARTADLKTDQNRIKALYARLNDAVVKSVSVPQPGQLQPPVRTAQRATQSDAQPPVIRAFREGGYKVIVQPKNYSDLSLAFKLGSNVLEMHRVVPLLAEQENSNAFLIVDDLSINRPAAAAPFSLKPTALESRLTVRLLATP
jgi:hypothetical protein